MMLWNKPEPKLLFEQDRIDASTNLTFNCDPTWTSIMGSTCEAHEKNEWCTIEGYGPAWLLIWGPFSNWGNNGTDARVCPQCGCGVKDGPKRVHQTLLGANKQIFHGETAQASFSVIGGEDEGHVKGNMFDNDPDSYWKNVNNGPNDATSKISTVNDVKVENLDHTGPGVTIAFIEPNYIQKIKIKKTKTGNYNRVCTSFDGYKPFKFPPFIADAYCSRRENGDPFNAISSQFVEESDDYLEFNFPEPIAANVFELLWPIGSSVEIADFELHYSNGLDLPLWLSQDQVEIIPADLSAQLEKSSENIELENIETILEEVVSCVDSCQMKIEKIKKSLFHVNSLLDSLVSIPSNKTVSCRKYLKAGMGTLRAAALEIKFNFKNNAAPVRAGSLSGFLSQEPALTRQEALWI